MHGHGLVRLSVFRIINYSSQLVTRDKEDVSCVKNIGSISLDNLGLTRNEPDEDVMLEYYFRFELFSFIQREFDMRCNILCFKLLCLKRHIIFLTIC
jgi:hypothetical protein